MADLRRILSPYYLTRPRLWSEPLGAIDPRTMVSRRWRYVCIRIPKAANSSVLRALLERFPEPGLNPEDIERAKARMTHFRDLMPWELRRVRRWPVIAVVRDPYARILSAYLDKFREGDRRFERLGATVAGHDGGKVSFVGFCRFLADGGEARNAHWMRQTRILAVADRVDLIGRVETLEADMEVILSLIAGAPERARMRRAGPPATAADARLEAFYDDECREIVRSVYAEDFARLGYPSG